MLHALSEKLTSKPLREKLENLLDVARSTVFSARQRDASNTQLSTQRYPGGVVRSGISDAEKAVIRYFIDHTGYPRSGATTKTLWQTMSNEDFYAAFVRDQGHILYETGELGADLPPKLRQRVDDMLFNM